ACQRFCDTLPVGPTRFLCLQQIRTGAGLCADCGADPRRLCQDPSGSFFCCAAFQHCDSGQCVSASGCPAGFSPCNGAWCSPARPYCEGICCPSGWSCLDGRCRSCPVGEALCGATCCPLTQECCEGACCDPGLMCVAGQCVDPDPCPAGQFGCGDACCNSSNR